MNTTINIIGLVIALSSINYASSFTQPISLPFSKTKIKLSYETLPLPSEQRTATTTSVPLHLTSSNNNNHDVITINPNNNNNNNPTPASLSRLENEFRTMMSKFSDETIYTPRDIESIPSSRTRALFYGVKSAASTPEVIRAFVILYEDFTPLRVAGRMIFKYLDDLIHQSKAHYDKQKESIRNTCTGVWIKEETFDAARKAFKVLDVHDKGELTVKELVDLGIVDTIVELFGFETFEEFMVGLDRNQNGRICFEEFMIGLHSSSSSSSGGSNSSSREREEEQNEQNEDKCEMLNLVEDIITRMENHDVDYQKDGKTLGERKKKYNNRYDNMLNTFAEWEKKGNVKMAMNEGGGRKGEILLGCFVGAKDEQIVEALRIVYVDYAALRMGGDLIFKLMKALVGTKKKNR